MNSYQPRTDRYQQMTYTRCGRSGLKLPYISLGLWHNFGAEDNTEAGRHSILRAFDLGITHFDLANNYGPPPGSAESFLGEMLATDLKPYRDELVISSKAGFDMWPGPYGDFGSRKYLSASLDQSLQRLNVDYLDIFYHHRYDPNTPLEETLSALADSVRAGKVLYIGLSNYPCAPLKKAADLLRELGTPCLIHQPRYNMFDRDIERDGVLDELGNQGIGCVPYSPLAQGLLTNKYFTGIPENSRANKATGFLTREQVTQKKIRLAQRLQAFALQRSQSLPQLAIQWLHSRPVVCSCIIGASNIRQIEELVSTQHQPALNAEELAEIDTIMASNSTHD